MIRPGLVFCGLLCLAVWGCNKPATESDGAMDVPDWLTEDEESSDDAGDTAMADAREDSPPKARSRSAAREPRGELKLNLNEGDRFPLRKAVTTTLTQESIDGTVQRIQSDLELLMVIQVRKVDRGRTLLGVKYNRVVFEQSLDGQTQKFDSQNPGARIPPVAQAYYDMIGDGFEFWIGADNQISEVVGFREFLARAMRNISPEQQRQVTLSLEAGADENGMSDFVDNTIGLLPFSREASPGQSWNRQRRIGRPIPMVIENQYTVQELSPTDAVVKITGQVLPSDAVAQVSQSQGDIHVRVHDGTIDGRCVIFRDTGLPKESITERVMNMTVDLGDGYEFKQTKTVQTVVESYPETAPH
ncbi:MAG: hypothetical protein DWH91_15915 [Planctomycetota bacterium]|nr:MAG: hypothetical protein DWH91_15915 [Planctomycetota bacterium]